MGGAGVAGEAAARRQGGGCGETPDVLEEVLEEVKLDEVLKEVLGGVLEDVLKEAQPKEVLGEALEGVHWEGLEEVPKEIDLQEYTERAQGWVKAKSCA